MKDLRSDRYGAGHFYQMRHDELYAALGLNPHHHLPVEGVSPTMIGNVRVWVEPQDPNRRHMKKRTFCACPRCDKRVEAGHLHQHLVACRAYTQS